MRLDLGKIARESEGATMTGQHNGQDQDAALIETPNKPDGDDSTHSKLWRAAKHHPYLIATNVVVGLIIILAAVVLNQGVRYPDELGYLEIGTGLANNGTFQLGGTPTAYRPPVWPLILAAASLVGLGGSLVFVVPAGLLIVAAFLASYIAYKLSGGLASGIAAVFVGLYPLNVYTSSTLYPQTFALASILALWAIWITILQSRTRSGHLFFAICAGLLTTALSLSVPTLAFTAAVFFVGISIALWRCSSRGLIVVAAFAGAATWSIWVLRNLVTMGQAVPLSTSSGFNLLLGNNAAATADSGVSADISRFVDAATARGLSELGRNDFYSEQAQLWIAQHPGEFLRLYASKLVNYFAPYNEPHSGVDGTTLQAVVAGSALIFIVSFCIVRLFLKDQLRISVTEKAAVALFIVNGPIMAIYFTRTRFRQPLDALIAIEAAVGLAIVVGLVLQASKAKRFRRGLRRE